MSSDEKTLNPEELDAMGQESDEKAAKWVKEKGKEWDKEEKEKEDQIISRLEEKTKYKFMDYKRLLAELFDRRATEESFPDGWQHHIAITDKGLVMYLAAPDKRLFARAFSPINEPKYDLVAILKILESAWKAIEEYNRPKGLVKPNG